MTEIAVQTVLGPISADDLGVVLMHEHVCPKPPVVAPPGKQSFHQRVLLEDVIRDIRHAHDYYNLRTILDCGTRLPKGDLETLARISDETGVKIIVCTGCQKEQYYHYSQGTMSSFWAYQLNPDQIADVMVRDITEGMSNTSIRAGAIKVGTTKQCITSHEERVLRGAARAHRRTGVPITTHATLGTMGVEQAQIFLEEGCDMSRVVIGHSGLNHNPAYHEGILRRGATVGFDTIGKQRFDYTRSETAGYHRYEFEKEQYFVSDEGMMQVFLEMVRRGYAGRIIVSSDMGSEIERNADTLAAWGYSFVLGKWIPDAVTRGLSLADEHRILVDTPRRILAGAA